MFSYSILYKTFNLQDEDEEERDSFSNVERPQLPDRGSERSILALIDNSAQHCNHPNQYYLDVTCCLIDTFNHHLPNLWWHIAIPTVFEIIPLCVWLIPPAIVYPTFGVTLQYHGLPVSNADSIWASSSVWLILSFAQLLHWSAFYISKGAGSKNTGRFASNTPCVTFEFCACVHVCACVCMYSIHCSCCLQVGSGRRHKREGGDK